MEALGPIWNQYLEERGISENVVRSRGYKVVVSGKPLDGQFAAAYGFPQKAGGLLIPLHPLLGGEAYQLRYTPGSEPNGPKGKPVKFLTPGGQSNCLSTSPLTRDLLDAPEHGIVVAEGVTRVDALARYGIPAVGLTGAASWRGKNDKGAVTALGDWEKVAIQDNIFILAFDADVTTNKTVNSAARRLSAFLVGKGAKAIWTLTLPGGMGLDDWIASEGFQDKEALLQAMSENGTRYLAAVSQSTPKPPPEDRLFGIDDAGDWARSPQGDAHRLMVYSPHKVCVVEPTDPQGSWAVLVEKVGGRWSRSAVDKVLLDSSLDWQRKVTEKAANRDLTADEAARCTKWAVQAATPKGRAETLASIGAVYGLLKERGIVPEGLTACQETDVDSDRFSLGTPEGVLCLLTGRLLPDEEARQRFVTRSIPDTFRADARHDYADALLAHVPAEEREYLVNAMGWSLRGNPSKLWYILAGEPDGAKTTLFTAVYAALGDAKLTGYAVNINVESILESRYANPNGHQAGLVGIHNARLAFAEEPAQGMAFNTSLIKDWTGGSAIQARDIREKGPVKPAMATLFVAMNQNTLDSVKLDDDALARRTKILKYPKLIVPEGGLDKERMKDIIQPAVRQAVVAMLVRACVHGAAAPKEPQSVKDFVEERVSESIGPVGLWLRERLIVTRTLTDVVNLSALWNTLGSEFGEKDGVIEGRDKKGTWTLAREQVSGLPIAKRRSTKLGNEWRGVLIQDAPIEEDTSAPVCEGCDKPSGGPKLCTDCVMQVTLTKTPSGGDLAHGFVVYPGDVVDETLREWAKKRAIHLQAEEDNGRCGGASPCWCRESAVSPDQAPLDGMPTAPVHT